jgi:ABC-type Fe3+-siderophore transport system, permease component
MMLLMSITTRDNMNHIMFWTMGSLNQSDFRFIALSMVTAIIGLCLSYVFVHTLNALRLGESKARYLGLDVKNSIRILFFIASMLTGVSVAVAGIIGFVGLVIPHIVRLLSGSDHRILLGASFVGGATFLVFCDTLSRIVIAPNELPIGVITGIAGGGVFIVVLLRNRKNGMLDIIYNLLVAC